MLNDVTIRVCKDSNDRWRWTVTLSKDIGSTSYSDTASSSEEAAAAADQFAQRAKQQNSNSNLT